MAEINDFGIVGTEENIGSQELIDDLFSEGSDNANPDEIDPINKDDDSDDANVSKTDNDSDDDKTSKTTKSNIDPKGDQSIINSLFEGDEDDDEEEDDKSSELTTSKSTKNSSDDESDDTDDINTFKILANDLLKQGVFQAEEDDPEELDINSPEEFLERFQKEKQKGAQQILSDFISQFGEDYQQAFQAIYVNGVEPKEYFGSLNKITEFASLDIEKESNQVSVIRQGLLNQGYDEQDVNDEIERLKDYGDLETVAKRHHKVLVKKESEQLKNLEQKKAQELQYKQEQKQQYANNVTNILEDKLKKREFDGIPLSPKVAKELQEYLIVDKWKTQSGDTITDFDKSILDLKRPENHEKKVKVALLLKMLDADPTLSSIRKKGVTEKSNKLFSGLARQTTSTKNNSSKKNNELTSWFK